jgi:hypothetical protein
MRLLNKTEKLILSLGFLGLIFAISFIICGTILI